ncbi:hypothetical protein L1787_17910 [Acuticoccus sp. M5D2P5]|uniref:hypothetical protein n=1 Tax=Acuticoccus kalidii TaxID=2910977 RepID=UPI001F2E805C|nr:hypothetical protein [Acuticoccus kalidii]MCF3935279.1 hypothetical protein [Acuticoccus kalidii]
MKEFLRLPYDSSGYGDFGISYVGIKTIIHFQYMNEGVTTIGELHFAESLSIKVNGILNDQKKLPYDLVMIEAYDNQRYDDFYVYSFMLSGSDFQFDVIAKGCIFKESIERSSLIQDN